MSPNPFDNRFIDLHSSMDRFEALLVGSYIDAHFDLHSSMDRFEEFVH